VKTILLQDGLKGTVRKSFIIKVILMKTRNSISGFWGLKEGDR